MKLIFDTQVSHGLPLLCTEFHQNRIKTRLLFPLPICFYRALSFRVEICPLYLRQSAVNYGSRPILHLLLAGFPYIGAVRAAAAQTEGLSEAREGERVFIPLTCSDRTGSDAPVL